jgi:aromatic-amino-acid transaminase
MLEYVQEQPEDQIIALMGLYSKDSRKDKLDLGVGVYKNAEGVTPIMSAVSLANYILQEKQTTKSYVGLLGNLSFLKSIQKLTLGDSIPGQRVVGAQTPGGTGAIHQIMLLVRTSNPNSTVWISDPTWPNHSAILKHLGIRSQKYSYFDSSSGEVDFNQMVDDLDSMKSGDTLLLHGCCHNPTGANLTRDNWEHLSSLCLKKGVTPLVDLAYQGFGDGLEKDVEGLRLMFSRLPEALLAVSGSKNFGVYRDRVGAAFVMADNEKHAKLAEDNLKSLNRLTFSFPPDHGASIIDIVLSDAKSSSGRELRKIWEEELCYMREGMLLQRKTLMECLRRETGSDRFDFLGRHRGMFSLLGLNSEQISVLRENFGIYMVDDSRINIAGLSLEKIPPFATAVGSVVV